MARIPASKIFIAWHLVMSCLILSRAAHADTPTDIRLLGRKTTALVHHSYEVYLDDGKHQMASRGTALCLTRSGYFLTDAHVIGPSKEVRIAIERPGKGVYFYDAYVVNQNKALDLAVLKVNNAEAFVPVEIAAPAAITRGMHVTAFGFPASAEDVGIREELIFSHASVRSGHVTALYGKGQTLSDVQTDTSLGPGSSGGPILNDRGQLVGIIQKGKRGSKATLAKSAAAILRFLALPEIAAVVNPPEIRFSPPAGIPASEITREHKFEVQVLAGLSSIQPAQATLTLNPSGSAPRVFQAIVRQDGSCDLSVAPFSPPSEPHTVTLTTSGSDRTQRASYQAADRSITIGARSVLLRDISRIDQGTAPVVTLLSGERILGQAQGLETVQIYVNGQPAARVLQGEKRIAVRDDGELPRAIQYSLSVTRAGKMLAVRTGKILLEGLPPRRMGQPIVIACGTAWATNNTGSNKGPASDLSPPVVRYIQNIADIFTGGAKANILIESDHWTFGAPFQEVLRSAGHTVTTTLDPGPLDQYDAVFVGGHEVDQQALADYVKRGGKVYLSGGDDANGGMWNAFLGNFGLSSQAETMPDPAPGSAFIYAPLFDGVSSLTIRKPYQIVRTPADMLEAQTICYQSETNLWAIYRAAEKLGPTPPQIAVIAARAEAEAQKIREHQFAIDHRTVDAVIIGDESSERKHNLKGDNLLSGEFEGRPWRAAPKSSAFSYTLKLDPKAENNLLCTFAWTDGQASGCTLYVDDIFLTRMELAVINLPPGCMCPVLFELPKRITAGKESVVVRFQMDERNRKSAEVFQCEIQRQVPGFDAKPHGPTKKIPRKGLPVVDTVKIGDPDSERAHNLQGDNTRAAPYNKFYQGRAAFDGGWFSYTMKVDPEELMALNVVYFVEDGEGHDFDILIDGVKLASVSVNKSYAANLYGATYAIPASLTKNKTQIVVRFNAHPGNIAGGIYGCKITKR